MTRCVLARRLERTGVTVYALHPGIVRTSIGREGDTSRLFELGIRVMAPLATPATRGAATTIYLASSPNLEGRTGEYWVRRRPRTPSRVARDEETARRLWDLSAHLVGL